MKHNSLSLTALALFFLSIIMTLSPANVYADESLSLYQHAFDLAKKGHYSQSIPQFEKYIKLYPKGEKIEQAHMLISNAMIKNKDNAGALRWLKKLTTEFPRSKYSSIAKRAMSGITISSAKNRNKQSTTHYYDRKIQTDTSTSPLELYLRGFTAYSKKNYPLAKELLQKLAQHPSAPKVYISKARETLKKIPDGVVTTSTLPQDVPSIPSLSQRQMNAAIVSSNAKPETNASPISIPTLDDDPVKNLQSMVDMLSDPVSIIEGAHKDAENKKKARAIEARKTEKWVKTLTDTTPFNLYKVTYGVTTRNWLLRNYMKSIVGSLAPKPHPKIKSFLPKPYTTIQALSDGKTERICFTYSSRMNKNRITTDCFIIQNNKVTGVTINLHQEGCGTPCGLHNSILQRLSWYKFKQVKESGSDNAVIHYLQRKNQKAVLRVWGGVVTTTSKTKPFSALRDYRSSFSVKTTLCLYPEDLEKVVVQDDLEECPVIGADKIKKEKNPILVKELKTNQACDFCPTMKLIPAGRFSMGSNKGNKDEKPVHLVTIAKPFEIATHELSLGEYKMFAKENNVELESYQKTEDDNHPIYFSYDSALKYIAWLNRKSGMEYRLPTEAEWEYAAKGGTSTQFFHGNNTESLCDYANLGYATDAEKENYKGSEKNYPPCDDGHLKFAPVGSFKPNQFGLYDLIGNAQELVSDCYHDNYHGAPVDGRAWKTDCDNSYVMKGGNYGSELRDSSVSSRIYYVRGSGVRLARDVPK